MCVGVCVFVFVFLCGCWGLNLALHACAPSILPTETPPNCQVNFNTFNSFCSISLWNSCCGIPHHSGVQWDRPLSCNFSYSRRGGWKGHSSSLTAWSTHWTSIWRKLTPCHKENWWRNGPGRYLVPMSISQGPKWHWVGNSIKHFLVRHKDQINSHITSYS